MSRPVSLAATGGSSAGSQPVGTTIALPFIEAALTAAVFTGSLKLIYGGKDSLFSKTNLTNSGVLGISVLINGYTASWLKNMLPNIISDANEYLVTPLVTGAYYSLITSYLTKSDNRPIWIKGLHGAAANMIAKNIEQPIKNMLPSQ